MNEKCFPSTTVELSLSKACNPPSCAIGAALWPTVGDFSCTGQLPSVNEQVCTVNLYCENKGKGFVERVDVLRVLRFELRDHRRLKSETMFPSSDQHGEQHLGILLCFYPTSRGQYNIRKNHHSYQGFLK